MTSRAVILVAHPFTAVNIWMQTIPDVCVKLLIWSFLIAVILMKQAAKQPPNQIVTKDTAAICIISLQTDPVKK